MYNGYCGINYFVKYLVIGKSEIISQNYGFGVSFIVIEVNVDKVEIIYVNLNDEIIEGIWVKGKLVFLVQYYLEVNFGLYDVCYLFDQFVSLMVEYKGQQCGQDYINYLIKI